MNRHIVGVTIRTWWTLVIVVSVSSIGTWAAIDHANANDQRNRERTNQQFRHSILLGQRKFQQAIRISTAQAAYSVNKSVCGFRQFTAPVLKSYEQAAKDPTLGDSARARNEQRIQTTLAFLDSQITVPPDFKCSSLPKKPPK